MSAEAPWLGRESAQSACCCAVVGLLLVVPSALGTAVVASRTRARKRSGGAAPVPAGSAIAPLTTPPTNVSPIESPPASHPRHHRFRGHRLPPPSDLGPLFPCALARRHYTCKQQQLPQRVTGGAQTCPEHDRRIALLGTTCRPDAANLQETCVFAFNFLSEAYSRRRIHFVRRP